MPILNTTQTITLTAGGGTIDLDVSIPIERYVITGTATLTSNWTIQPADTLGILIAGVEYIFYWNANITPDGNTVTLFGSTVPEIWLNKDVRIKAYYNGTTWNVDYIPDFNQNSVLNYDATIGLSTSLSTAKKFMVAIPFDFEGTGESGLTIPLNHFGVDMYLERVNIKITQALSGVEDASFTVISAVSALIHNFDIPLSSAVGYSMNQSFNELIYENMSSIELQWKKTTTGGRGVALLYFRLL